jgi:starch-binding outer membrane protein, SusD/RagB family
LPFHCLWISNVKLKIIKLVGMKKIKIISFSLIVLSLGSCKKDLLNVENTNDPDFKRVYAKGKDVENVASGLFNTIFYGEHSGDGVEAMLATAADHVSCSWGNFAMRDMSWEPRNSAWNNAPSYSNASYTKYTFDQMYSAINTASNIIKAINGGVEIGAGGVDNNRTLAFARFAQGVAYGNLALVFDKAFIVDETKTVEPKVESAVDYKQVAAEAIKYLDEAISLSNNNFSIPAAWMSADGDISNVEFKKICNTAAARILSYTPRNKADLAAVGWAKVQAYADAGITEDWLITQDNYVKWYFEAGDYLTFNGWGITDMYVVNMLDPTQPKHWDDSPNFPYPPKSTNPLDKRLDIDFEYVPSNWFQAARGYYHFSSYRFKRYDDIYVNGDGQKAEVMLSENDMLRAEARAYLGDLGGAAAIINAGTRKTRGQMTDVAADLQEIIKAIHHERHVELYTTGMGVQFFEMRKLDLLQKGTPLHLPLPAKILETFGVPLPFYTFGTVDKADGKNTSNGGWR